MRCRTGATPTSKRRSTRSSTTSPRRSRPTAISTAGTTGASPTSAGPTCATTTSSTTPAICSKARSPISAPPARAALPRRRWSATSTTSPRPSGRGPGQKRGYPGHQEIELALVKLYRLTGDQPAARSRRLFHRRARPSAALFHRRKRSRAATTRRTTGREPTSTTSRTFPCASRPRWSAMRCAACTWPRRWPTSPSNSTTSA